MEYLENINAFLPIGEGSAGIGTILITVVIGIVIAFYSYKIFRVALSVMGALIFGGIGEMYVAPMIIKTASEGMFNYSALIALGCAMLGAILMGAIYKLALFISGAAIGYLSGGFIASLLAPSVEFFASEKGILVTGVASALILGVLSIFLFKFLYIVGTGLLGMYISGSALIAYAMQGDGNIVKYAPIVIALVGGIIAATVQYKREDY